MRLTYFLALAIGTWGLLVDAPHASASITVTSGGAAFEAGVQPAVRYKGFSNVKGVNTGTYLGENSLGTGGNRVEQTNINNYYDLVNPNAFTFTFDGATTVTSQIGIHSTLSDTLSADPGLLNAVQLRVRNAATGTVTLSGLTINGDSTLSPATSFTASASDMFWTLTGFNLTNGFTITGSIDLDIPLSNNEGSQVELVVGYITPVPEVTSLCVWGGMMLVGGVVLRRRLFQAV